MATHEEIVQSYNNYLAEHATRARKALGDLGKLTKDRRKEIIEKKNSM